LTLSDRVLGRLISGLEYSSVEAGAFLDQAWRGAEPAFVAGLSGPPGVGKSLLTGRLLHSAVAAGRRPAVIAVDPSSPFSGGAVLADRMRLQALGVPQGVFVRSLASRGALGGLSAVVPAAVRALEAAGYGFVLVETVGVGQNEIDVMGIADTVIVIQAPNGGDEIQGLKSGLLEIADIFVVNKCDLAGAEQARAVLKDVARSSKVRGWFAPVILTNALTGAGVEELWRALEAHEKWLLEAGLRSERRKTRLAAELLSAANAELRHRLSDLDLIERFRNGKATIRDALSELLGGEMTDASANDRRQKR
jgi:LAO/AO transport system kinase